MLLGRGPKVLFELELDDGTVRRGLVLQRSYPLLRRDIEAIARRRPGQNPLWLGLAGAALLAMILLQRFGGKQLEQSAPVLIIGAAVAFWAWRRREAQRLESRPADRQIANKAGDRAPAEAAAGPFADWPPSAPMTSGGAADHT